MPIYMVMYMVNGSDVFFTDMRTRSKGSLLAKMERLVHSAGIDKIDMDKKFVAIKIHFGEPGNLSYIRPNYVRTLVNIIREKGGIPFLTDCSTLYVGRRKDAIEHLDSAYENGFDPFVTGCHVIIGDGVKGDDDAEVRIDCPCLKTAKIGRSVVDADIVISMNHFKCHELMGFGGAIKNLGMGCASRQGKMVLHSSNKPSVNEGKCEGCGHCVNKCAHSAIVMKKKKAFIDRKKCVGCGRCISMCRYDAISAAFDQAIDVLCKRTAEYALASVIGKPNFHISFLTDVSPACDCYGENDIPIIPDVGIFASFDPVALDVACAEIANGQPAVKESVLHEKMKKGKDIFSCVHSVTDWRIATDHAEKIGLGYSKYVIRKVE